MKQLLLLRLTVLTTVLLTACAGIGVQNSKSTDANLGVDWLDDKTDFVNTVRRADFESDDGFNFRVTFFENSYKKYLVEPYVSVFKIYIKSIHDDRAADSAIVMCSASEICVLQSSGQRGYYNREIYRAGFSLKDGKMDFTIPSQFIPKRTKYSRGVFLWAFKDIDHSLWRVSLSKSGSDLIGSIEVPFLSSKAKPFSSTKYSTYLELI